MNRFITVALITVGTILGTALARADNAVYSCVDAYGVESLTNVPIDANCKRLFTYTMPTPPANETTAPATPAPAASTAAAASTAVAHAAAPVERANRKTALVNGQAPTAAPRTPLEERLAQRRDVAIEQTRAAYSSDLPLVGMNRAVNRRYLMTNRAAYQKAIGVMQD
jgi:hypothetical protein